MKKRKITCTLCPLGCEMEVLVDEEKDEVISVEGNECPQGEEFAIQRIKEIRCEVPTTVEQEGNDYTLAVKTEQPVSRELIPDVMKETAYVKADIGTKKGDIIISNVAGTGADLVAISDYREIESKKKSGGDS